MDITTTTYTIFKDYKELPRVAKCYSCHTTNQEELLPWRAQDGEEEFYYCKDCFITYSSTLEDLGDIFKEEEEEQDFNLKDLFVFSCKTCKDFFVGMDQDKECSTCRTQRWLVREGWAPKPKPKRATKKVAKKKVAKKKVAKK